MKRLRLSLFLFLLTLVNQLSSIAIEDKYKRRLDYAFTKLTTEINDEIIFNKDKELTIKFNQGKIISPKFTNKMTYEQTDHNTIEVNNIILTYSFNTEIWSEDTKLYVEPFYLIEVKLNKNIFKIDDNDKLILIKVGESNVFISDAFSIYSYNYFRHFSFKNFCQEDLKERLNFIYVNLLSKFLKEIQ